MHTSPCGPYRGLHLRTNAEARDVFSLGKIHAPRAMGEKGTRKGNTSTGGRTGGFIRTISHSKTPRPAGPGRQRGPQVAGTQGPKLTLAMRLELGMKHQAQHESVSFDFWVKMLLSFGQRRTSGSLQGDHQDSGSFILTDCQQVHHCTLIETKLVQPLYRKCKRKDPSWPNCWSAK